MVDIDWGSTAVAGAAKSDEGPLRDSDHDNRAQEEEQRAPMLDGIGHSGRFGTQGGEWMNE